jgi:hypothetical protein
MRHPRSLSRLLCVLAALSFLAMPLAAGAAPAKKAPAAATKTTKKVDKARSAAAKKGWETRRMNQKAESNWASRIAKNPKADKPGAREAFVKRSVAAQRGWQTRKAAMSSGKKATGKRSAKKKNGTKKNGKKVAAAQGEKGEQAPAPATEPDMIASAGVGAADFQKAIGKFDEARFAQNDGREMDAAEAQMHGHDAMAQSAYDTADAYEAQGRVDEANKLRAFGDDHLARADAIEQAINQAEEAARPGPFRRFLSFLNPFKKRNRGGDQEEVRVAGQ